MHSPRHKATRGTNRPGTKNESRSRSRSRKKDRFIHTRRRTRKRERERQERKKGCVEPWEGGKERGREGGRD